MLCQQVPRKKRSIESIVQEFHTARMEAIHAKERGDKKSHEQASRTIRKIKQEISALGGNFRYCTFMPLL